MTILYNVILNPYGTDLAWNYIRENWESFEDFRPTRIISYFSMVFFDKIHRQEMQAFLEYINMPVEYIDFILEGIDSNIQFKSTNIKSTCGWLNLQEYHK